ncbi:MmyB family transcriptional regulator [Streptomyces sp. NPDC003863]
MESLGAFLKSRRDRVTPDRIGLHTYGTARRVPGLRREDLAHLTGVSAGYYARLEQCLAEPPREHPHPRVHVASPRLTAGRFPTDAHLANLIGELTVRSDRFATLWAGGEVSDCTVGDLRLRHPTLGALSVTYQVRLQPDSPVRRRPARPRPACRGRPARRPGGRPLTVRRRAHTGSAIRSRMASRKSTPVRHSGVHACAHCPAGRARSQDSRAPTSDSALPAGNDPHCPNEPRRSLIDRHTGSLLETL